MADVRGSDRLQHIRKRELSRADLEAIASLAERDGVEIADWTDHGIPAIDQLEISWLVKPPALGSLVDELVKLERFNHFEGFPLGRPAVEQILLQTATQRTR